MKRICRFEKKRLKAFIKLRIPEDIKKNEEEIDGYDILYCYEQAFTFAHGLLSGGQINPNLSPWGDGYSDIFEDNFKKLLKKLSIEADEEVRNFCVIFLEVLDIFGNHFIS